MDFEFNEMSDDELDRVLGEVSEHVRYRVMSKVNEILSMYDDITPPVIKYDLKGHTAGWAIGGHTIRLNAALLNNPRYVDDMIEQTVPHEVAHIIVHQRWPRAKGHGREWQHVMHRLGLNATRCHQYNTTAARTTAKPYVYYCHCTTPHHVTKLLHTRIQRRIAQGHSHYICKICKGRLRERR